jgi:glucose-1-phosphate cytidylyltransferase
MKEKTEFIPKPLVPIGGRPILWHIMKMYAHHGYNDFVIALGYKGEMISSYFAKNLNDGFNITFVDTGEESSTGERVLRVKDHIPEEEFMLTYGDGVADVDIQKLAAFHRAQGTLATLTGVNPRSRFGLINIDHDTNHVTGFLQKPVMHDRINGGFMVFNRAAFEHFDSGSVENVFDVLIPRRQLSVYSHDGFWKCMDTYQEVEELNELWRESKPWALWER